MKYLIIIVLLYGSISCCQAQAKGTVVVPVFKESKAIDNLIDIINAKTAQQKKPVKGNYMLMLFFKQKNQNAFIFQVEESAAPFANRAVGDLTAPGYNYGYFEYKNKKVIVSTSDRLYNFFSKTARNKTINYIQNLPKKDPNDTTDATDTWLYRYKNGQFSVYVKPVIMWVKK